MMSIDGNRQANDSRITEERNEYQPRKNEMLNIITKGTREVLKAMERDAKQMRFATAVALTKTAKRAKEEVSREMQKTFDQPKPFTLKSGFIKPAKKDNLQARIGIKPLAAGYLEHQVERKDRAVKGAEIYMRRKRILPPGMFIVPGAIRLDRYGNISRAMLKKILEGVSQRGGRFFVADINGTAGIWQKYGRKGRSVKPILLFVDRPQYTPKLDFYGVTKRVFDRHYHREFDKAYKRALETAR